MNQILLKVSHLTCTPKPILSEFPLKYFAISFHRDKYKRMNNINSNAIVHHLFMKKLFQSTRKSRQKKGVKTIKVNLMWLRDVHNTTEMRNTFKHARISFHHSFLRFFCFSLALYFPCLTLFFFTPRLFFMLRVTFFIYTRGTASLLQPRHQHRQKSEKIKNNIS